MGRPHCIPLKQCRRGLWAIGHQYVRSELFSEEV
jgi:hypothetical protein